MKKLFLGASALLLLAACGQEQPASQQVADEAQLDPIAERYVRLALALGEHDDDYVDAYFGPAEWREQAKQEALDLAAITVAADKLVAELQALKVSSAERYAALRHNFLLSHLGSMAAISRMRNGETLSFDEESRAVYGFVAPSFPLEHYDDALQKLEALLPGNGPLHERYQAFLQQFKIPEDKVKAVVRKGLEACREQTRQHMTMVEGENFSLEFVTGQPWSAYNWYQGNGQGLIQINLDRPKYLGTSIRLGCHEGYPGHHLFSTMLDAEYLQKRGWVEFSVLPLFSPQGMIFEGSGDLASRVAFPGDERTAFLRDVIVPIAGLGTVDLETAAAVREATQELRYAGIEAARHYLDGDWSKEQTIEWLTSYALVGPESIDAWFGFTARYRAYRINYVLGEDLVLSFVRARNPDADPEGDWDALAELLSLPPTPALFADER
ncbi:MAG: hypothetical protein OEM99_00800 [Gammaproteobacteria bacterium]|nr:hypothetical protein [Gammaproteobacteria bacterium]